MQHPALRTDEDSIVIFNCKDTEVGAGKQKLLTDSLTMSSPASSQLTSHQSDGVSRMVTF